MIPRHWTADLNSPYDDIDWATSRVDIIDHRTGTSIYSHDGIEHPVGWSTNAVEICASKYLRRADIPDIGGEHSLKQLAWRVASCLANHGVAGGYFSASDGDLYRDEIISGFLHQRVGFNSPVWFNFGLFSEYGICGNGGRRRYYYDSRAGGIAETMDELERPSGAACYLSGVSDTLFSPDESGMADLLSNEQKIFLTGAGDGVNVSDIRGTGEPISGGGRSSGLIAFLKVRDACAGYIRSGGRTRRSATLLCCELDHPDIFDFIDWKEKEELKAHALMESGFSGGMDGEAYGTVSGQNSNNSVRVSNAFMQALERDESWHLISRVEYHRFADALPVCELMPGDETPQGSLWLGAQGTAVALIPTGETYPRKIVRTVRAAELWQRICESAWRCGCPGIQFDDLINDWNTVPQYGRIRTTNPCAEICLPDWSVCNLGSINLMQFFEDLDAPDWDGFRHAVRLMTVALDLVVDMSSYPTHRHAEGSVALRAIGLNHGNIGAVLMRNGIAYDSDIGRDWMAQITSFMTLESYRMSLELAERLGSYPAYNAEDHRLVLKMHRDAATHLKGNMATQLADDWNMLCTEPRLITSGIRNNTTTTIPPQGTIGLVLDQDTLGCEPEFCLVKHKTLSGGGSMMIANQSVYGALRRLDYTPDQIGIITDYIGAYGTAEGCDALLAEHLPVFDTAVKPGNCLDIAAVKHLKKAPDQAEAVAAISSAKNREEAIEALPPHLKYLALYVKVFTRSISIDGHVKALAALQPHLSHSISKTCNMDHASTPDDISRTYRMAYDLGVKCVAIYRDGSKSAQPLSAGARSKKAVLVGEGHSQNGHRPGKALVSNGKPAGDWDPNAWPATKRPTPHHTSNCDLFHFRIADPVEKQGLFINATLYPDSPDLMAIFVNTGRQGETTNGLVHSLARVISCALQHGVPAQEIGRKLAGMSFPPHGFLGETSAFGIHRAKSISDLIGRLLIALPDYYAANRDPAIMHPIYEQTLASTLRHEALSNGFGESGDESATKLDSISARGLGYTGKPCQNCSSYETIGGAECYVCKSCGQSNGPCAG